MLKMRFTSLSFILLLLAAPLYAQNTGGVFPPTVSEGHKSWQYRWAVDPESANGDTAFAQRLHYQQAINDDFMWRIVGQVRKTDDSDFDPDFLQAELFWEFSEAGADYTCLLYTSPSPRDRTRSRMPSSA